MNTQSPSPQEKTLQQFAELTKDALRIFTRKHGSIRAFTSEDVLQESIVSDGGKTLKLVLQRIEENEIRKALNLLLKKMERTYVDLIRIERGVRHGGLGRNGQGTEISIVPLDSAPEIVQSGSDPSDVVSGRELVSFVSNLARKSTKHGPDIVKALLTGKPSRDLANELGIHICTLEHSQRILRREAENHKHIWFGDEMGM